MRKGDAVDPKGLIEDAYRMEGLEVGECRTIFLDWALSIPQGADSAALIATLLKRHGEPGHPMTDVLQAGLSESGRPQRRGGRGGRVGPQG